MPFKQYGVRKASKSGPKAAKKRSNIIKRHIRETPQASARRLFGRKKG